MKNVLLWILAASALSSAAVFLILWKLDNSSGPADRISLALTAANITYSSIIFYLSFKYRSLRKFIDEYLAAASRSKSGPAKKIFAKILDHRVLKSLPHIREISDGFIQKENPTHFEFTEELYSGASVSINAVSSVDPECYWLNESTRKRADAAQICAMERNVKVARYFVFEDCAMSIAYFGIMDAQRSRGVEVWYVLLSDVIEPLRSRLSTLDCSIYDDCCIQVFEFKSSEREAYSKCTVSIREEDLDPIREQLSALVEYRYALPNGVEKMHGFDDISSKSTAANSSTKAYYGDARSPAPDLKLYMLAGLPNKTSILDIGCGGGRMMKSFLDSFDCSYVGIDRDPVAIQSCRDILMKNPSIHFRQQEFLTYASTVEDEKFDIALAYNSIYHASRDDFFMAISEARRCLRKGGYFLLTVKTVSGNEYAMRPRPGMNRINVDPHNSFIHCNFPDHGNIHHFCDDEEISKIKAMFLTIHEEQSAAKIDPQTGEVIHGAGIYFIFQKS